MTTRLPPPLPWATGESPPPALIPATRPVVLRLEGLRKRLGRTEVLQRLDVEVRAGDIYGFLGRNGAGKTTAIRSIMGILQPDSGRMQLLGRELKRADRAAKQRIGYVSQEPFFYSWMTCRALGRFVAGFYPTWDHTEFARLLRVLELPEKRRFSHLSGGMKIKLALALALAHRPDLLILDEPTAGMDAVARREFLDLIASQARHEGRTTFFSTHRIEEVERVANRVGLIDGGRQRYEGGVEELKQTVRLLRGMPAEEDAAAWLARVFAHEAVELLRDETRDAERRLVVRAEPAQWERLTLPAPVICEALSLEEIFLAHTTSQFVEL